LVHYSNIIGFFDIKFPAQMIAPYENVRTLTDADFAFLELLPDSFCGIGLQIYFPFMHGFPCPKIMLAVTIPEIPDFCASLDLKCSLHVREIMLPF
jgi:hypothetical protein